MSEKTEGRDLLTAPIPDAFLEERRQDVLRRPSFIERLRARNEGQEEVWTGPDLLSVSRVRVEVDGQTVTRHCLMDDEGCALTSEDLRKLVDLVTEIHDSLPDEAIRHFNVNQRERVFMRWVENNSGESYQDHIDGIGRPRRRQGKRKHRPGFVYIAECEGVYKIGRSLEPEARMRSLRGPGGGKVSLVVSFKSDDAVDLENELHVWFKEKHLEGEWFSLLPEDIETLKQELGGTE